MDYENFATLVKYSKDEKTLEEIKRDLTDFDNENVKTKKTAYSSIVKGNVSTARKRELSQKTVGLTKYFMNKLKLPQ